MYLQVVKILNGVQKTVKLLLHLFLLPCAKGAKRNQKGTKKEPKRNQKGTKKELKRNRKGTKKEPKRNQKGTQKELKWNVWLTCLLYTLEKPFYLCINLPFARGLY